MRFIAFLVIIAATFFVAGATGSVPLLICFSFECLMIPAMLVLLAGFRKNISYGLERKNGAAQKDSIYQCGVVIFNRGKIPVNKLKLRIASGFSTERKRKKQTLQGNADCGENTVRFEVKTRYCGLMRIRIRRLYLYDYLFLFSMSKSNKNIQEFELAVFPKERPILEGLPEEWFLGEGLLPEGETSPEPGNEHGEIRQLREYRDGDDFRNIHWKLTARTGEIWIREYEREFNTVEKLLVEMQDRKHWKASEADEFYELLSGIVLGILSSGRAVRVSWYDGKQREIVEYEIRDRHKVREMLYEIFQTNAFWIGKKGSKAKDEAWKRWKELNSEALCLTDGLCIFRGTELLRNYAGRIL